VSETDLFVNEGFGWECRRCRDSGPDAPPRVGLAADAPVPDPAAPGAEPLPRFFREGEAEDREARLSSRALARWRDTPRGRALHCPRCGAEEVPPGEG